MQSNNKKSKILQYGLLSVLLCGMLLLVVPTGAVHAQTEEEPILEESEEPGRNIGNFFEGVLVRMFAYEKSMAVYLDRTVSQSDRIAGQAQDRITELQTEGKDTTALEEALDSFYSLTSEAEQSLDAANSLLDIHAGFDDDGRVTDLEQARDTVFALEEYVSSARSDIVAAIQSIIEGLQSYREANAIEE